jgi:hypothetical protein
MGLKWIWEVDLEKTLLPGLALSFGRYNTKGVLTGCTNSGFAELVFAFESRIASTRLCSGKVAVMQCLFFTSYISSVQNKDYVPPFVLYRM